jgi:hypothetical protein
MKKRSAEIDNPRAEPPSRRRAGRTARKEAAGVRRPGWLVLAALFLLFSSSESEEAIFVYVSPSGNDAWTGTSSSRILGSSVGPLASLEGAKQRILGLRRTIGPLPAPIRVRIMKGTYFLNETFRLGPEDGGTETSPVIYEAADPAGHPFFLGGRTIRDFTAWKNGIWRAPVPETSGPGGRFEELFVNGRRATRARTPNQDHFYVRAPIHPVVSACLSNREHDCHRRFLADLNDLSRFPEPEEIASGDVVLVAYDAWEAGLDRLAAVDRGTGEAAIAGLKHWAWPFGRQPNQRYHLENYLSALDEPGEWFLARDGYLYYYPLPEEDPNRVPVFVPVLNSLVEISGRTPSEPVRDIRFRGLRFLFCGHPVPVSGYHPTQAADGVPAAITIDRAEGILFEDCEVAHVGGNAFWFRIGCRDCAVRDGYLHDLGAGGVRIGPDWFVHYPTVGNYPEGDFSSRITVDNTIIHEGGRIYRGATGIFLTFGNDNVLTHNDISDLRYSGISAGHQWTTAKPGTERNLIAWNRIHHLGQKVLSDLGGIYTLGKASGTVIRNNVIHDLWDYGLDASGAFGIYNDGSSQDVLIENNLVYDTADGGNVQGFRARGNILRNNIFAYSRGWQIAKSRRPNSPPPEALVEGNIFFWDGGELFIGPEGYLFRRNLYFNEARDARVDRLFNKMTFAEWQAGGQDASSAIFDPGFADPGGRNFHLPPAAQAKLEAAIGFKGFDIDAPGVKGKDRLLDWINSDRPVPGEPRR